MARTASDKHKQKFRGRAGQGDLGLIFFAFQRIARHVTQLVYGVPFAPLHGGHTVTGTLMSFTVCLSPRHMENTYGAHAGQARDLTS